MSLPTLAKTWNFHVNNTQVSQGSAALDGQALLYAIKSSMIANGWTVKRSSNGTTVSNSDLWTSVSALVWVNTPGQAHAWTILENDNIATGFQICLECQNNGGGGQTNQMTIGFCGKSYDLTTGTTGARPSALAGGSETVLINLGNWIWDNADRQCVWHAMYSSDFQCTRIIICQGGAPVGLWVIDKPQNPPSGWTNPNYFLALGSGSAATNVVTDTNLFQNAKGYSHVTNGLTSFTAVPHYPGCEGYGNVSASNNQTGVNDSSGNYPFLPVSLWSTTANTHGRNGTLFDTYYGLAMNPTGTTFPSSAPLYQWAQFGSLIVPWNGTAPLTA